MKEKDIFFILVQIDEAHTPLWPQGTITLGTPQVDLADRVARALQFASKEIVGMEVEFVVCVDPWNNAFADRYRAWPDKYYLLGADGRVLQKSTYGATADAVIDLDCVDLIHLL